jgi:isopenicillin N synthase-like dioxygenase
MSNQEVPVADMSWTADRFTDEFGLALERFGFVSVINHGIARGAVARAYSAARNLFALPLEVKRKYERPAIGRQRGYTPIRTEHAAGYGKPNLNEYFHFGRPDKESENVYPSELPESSARLMELFAELDGLSMRLLSSLGVYLGRGPEHFPAMAVGGNSLLRVLRYPKVEAVDGEVGSAAHKDINLITLLTAATRPGLWIKPRGGAWLPVDNPPDAIIVNAGDMLELNTLWRIPSTPHRVIMPADHDGERYSMPFFVHPRGEVPLVTAGQYLEHRLRENKVA